MKISQLIVFANGDAWDSSTWSNVPYMFLTTFKRLCPDVDIRVFDMGRVDSGAASLIVKCWNHFVPPVKGNLYTFDRTRFRHWLLNRKMSRFERFIPREGGVLLSFDFSNPAPRLDGYKVALLCDWTIEYAICEHQHRTPTASEQKLIQRQEKAIASADHVTVLFPHSAGLIRDSCPETEVAYYGLPANVVGGLEPNLERFHSRRLVFVGNSSYIESLRVVAEGVTLFNSTHPGDVLYLDVIGMNDGPGRGGYVTYHGYLRKDNNAERNKYYDLVTNSRALITVSDSWVGASSIVEAMSLGTPVVVTPNLELEAMLGEDNWGYWCDCSAQAVASRLVDLEALSKENFREMCRAAKSAVESLTWENMISRWCEDVGFAVNR